ncbi:diacylglycerol kinase [Listeria fleischmannii]
MVLIYNPAAGKNKFRKWMRVIEEKLVAADFNVTLVSSTSEPKSVLKLAKAAADSGVQTIVAAGGDGTVNEVVNGIMRSDKRPVLGILPMGTTNDYARALGVNKNPLDALNNIINRETVEIDIGKANRDEFFINNVAAGKITEITYAVSETKKNRYGRLAYLLDGLKMLPKLRSTNVEITFDSEQFSGPILLCFVNNSNTVGGLESLCPPAEINDGYFDLLILKKVSKAKLFSLFLLLKRGTHLESPYVIYRQVKNVKLESNDDLNVSYDGVYGGPAPYELEILANALQVFASKETLHSLQKKKNQ